MNSSKTPLLILCTIIASLTGRETNILSNKSESTGIFDPITIERYEESDNPESLLNRLLVKQQLPAGVTITNLEIKSGSYRELGVGSYSRFPQIEEVTLADGIILSTGSVDSAVGPNSSSMKSTCEDKYGLHDDKELEDIAGGESYNSSSFLIEFTSDERVDGISFDFCFGSEEFPEFTDSRFNDVFAVFLDGENIVYDENGVLISANNSFFGIDNNGSDPYNPVDTILNLEMDGLTSPLRTSALLSPGKHTLRFAIADIGDDDFDSNVFISSLLFEFTEEGTKKIEEEEQNFSVSESALSGTEIGEVQLKEPGTTLELLTQTPAEHFSLSGNRLFIKDNSELDYETVSQYKLQMAAHLDGFESDTFSVMIYVLDELENDNLLDDYTFTIMEDMEPGTVIGTVTPHLPDVNMNLLSQVPKSDFELSGNDIMLKKSSHLVFGSVSRYTLNIVAHLTGFEPDTAVVTVSVIDVVDSVNIDFAAIYDENGDGKGDLVKISLSKPFTTFAPDSLKIEFPTNENRKIVLIDPEDILHEHRLEFRFSNLSDTIATGGRGEVVLDISTLNMGTVLADLDDSIGPVLIDTAFIREDLSGNIDTLSIQFSEEIDHDVIGFSLKCISENSRDDVEVLSILKSEGNFLELTVRGESFKNGDSIAINHHGPIRDKNNNGAHRDNRPVPVKIIRESFEITSSVIGPVNPHEYELPLDVQKFGFRISRGVPIILIPSVAVKRSYLEEFLCSIRIVDNVGNTIAVSDDCREMSENIEMNIVEFDTPMLLIVWSGKNRNSRYVASGTYMGNLNITLPDGREVKEKIVIPVKR